MSTVQEAVILDVWIEAAGPDEQQDALVYASFAQEDRVGPVPMHLDRNQVRLGMELIEQEAADSETVRNVGGVLFRALFSDAISDLYQRSRGSASERGLALHVRLHIASERWAELPWELLHDGQRFLGLDLDTSISRYPDLDSKLLPSLEIQGPLRILVVIAGPANFPDIQRELQAAELRKIFGGLQAEGILEVEFLPRATCAGLMRCLRGGDFHILHFVGYCASDPESRAPGLVFEEEDGKARKVTGDELSGIINSQYFGRSTENTRPQRATPLRMVVINDREISAGVGRNYSTQVAASLLRSKIPVVLDLKHSLPDDTTRTFVATFYRALANGHPVDTAIAEARSALQDTTAWGAPVLFIHAADGQVFRPRQVKQMAFEQFSAEIEDKISSFSVRMGDAPTKFFLKYLWLFILLSAVGTLAYLLVTWSRRVPDLMFAVMALAIFTWIWLLRSLLWTRVPDTFDKVWRRRLVLPRDPSARKRSWLGRVFAGSAPIEPSAPGDRSSLAKQYSDFLDDYNSLLNHDVFLWIMRVVSFIVALFAILRLKFESESGPEQWQIVVFLLLAAILGLLAAYVIGTLLWQMIATVIATRRLSYRFRLDMFPGHTDGCNGLKPLGDLYFAHARVLSVPGIITAIVVLVLSLSYTIVVRDLSTNVGGEVSKYALEVCKPERNAHRPDTAEFAQRIARFGGNLDQCPNAPRKPPTTIVTLLKNLLSQIGLSAVLHWPSTSTSSSGDSSWDCGNVLRCMVYSVPRQSPAPPQSQLVLLAAESLWFYRWFMPYSVLLAILIVLTIITFVFPMYNTHREMNRMKGELHHKADGMIGEITELQHSFERFTTISGSEIEELTREWEWLQHRCRQYENPPTWPFDARVKARLGGALVTMLGALVTSIIIPMISDFLLR